MKFIILISNRDCKEAPKVLDLYRTTSSSSVEGCQWTWIFYDTFTMGKEEESKVTWMSIHGDNDVEQIKESVSCEKDDKKEQTLNTLKVATEKLHNAANTLPSVGALLEVYLWPPNAEDASYIPFLGSLRRLRDWHNAHVTLLDRELGPASEFLHRFLAADICISSENLVMPGTSEALVWRGKLSVCDKIENSCVMIPGVSVLTTDRSASQLQFPRRPNTSQDDLQSSCAVPGGMLEVLDEIHLALVPAFFKTPHEYELYPITRESSRAVPGRVLEVLDEIHLASVPAFLKTPHEYKLCFYQKHSYCQILMNYLTENIKTGLLVRLAVYPAGREAATCADIGLSTDAWKESISADIQFAQEPEEEMQDNYEFLYFVITSPDLTLATSSASGSKFEARMFLLQHPYHLAGGALVSTIYHQSLVPQDKDFLSAGEFDLGGLPVLAEGMLTELLTDLQVLQQQMIQNLIEEKKQSGESTVVSVEEFTSFLRGINLNYLERLAEKLPVHTDKAASLKVDLNKNITGSLEKPYDWPERLIQQYMESQKRTLSRIQSSESVPLSSPLQPAEACKTIDIESFLRCFHPDGSTATTNLSPIRRRHPNRSHSRGVGLSDGISPQQVMWPDSKDMATHDIYYNLDRRSEKVNNHLNKLQEKYVKDETYSSCRSGQVTFPKCTKKKQQASTDLELRRSPRKRAPPPTWDESGGPEPKRQKVRGNRLSVLQEREPKRRHSLAALPEPSRKTCSSTPQGRRSESGSGGVRQVDKSRRESDIGLSKSRRESDCGLTNSRRESDCGLSTSLTQGEKKESRSERHKRKLLDIVEGVLIENGVDKSEPIFESCSSRLYKVTKLFVMDLPTSRNLKAEMRKIAESQVKQVIEVDRQRQATSQGTRHKKKSV